MAPHNRQNRQNRIDLTRVGNAGTVVALLANGFSVPDFNRVAHAAEKLGFRTLIASPQRALVSGRSETNEEMNFVVDMAPGDVSTKAFDGLVVPGGERNVAALQDSQDARLLLHDFVKSGKPVFVSGEALEFLAEVSEKQGITGEAALAIQGEVFAGAGETSRDDAATAFAEALQPADEVAA